MSTFKITDDRQIEVAFTRWLEAKDQLDAATTAEKVLNSTLRALLMAKLPDGAQLLDHSGHPVAAWTRNSKTTVDAEGLASEDIRAFTECLKPPAVDVAALTKMYPALAEKFVAKTPSDVYTLARK